MILTTLEQELLHCLKDLIHQITHPVSHPDFVIGKALDVIAKAEGKSK